MSDERSEAIDLIRNLLSQSPKARAEFEAMVVASAEVEDMRKDAHRELVRLNGEAGYERWRADTLRKRLTDALAEYERGWPSSEVPS